jgi:hypothetical protein
VTTPIVPAMKPSASPERESRAAYAHMRVHSAIKSGALVRPAKCERCLRDPGRGKDGRSLIQAHHHDYTKPLDVEWICARCHRVTTPFPANPGAPVFGARNGMRTHPGLSAGSRNGSAKLSEAMVAYIKSKRGAVPAVDLAKQYGVTDALIRRIWRGANWPNVKASA